MNAYEEKKQTRIDRYRGRAEKARSEADTRRKAADGMSSAIPMGQPILIGHHSEKRHRRDVERIHSNMDKSIEAGDKAEYYENKASAAENNNAISSDDPEAITKLKEKLLDMEEKRKAYKEFNKKARKEGTDPLESWQLSNLGQNIRSIKQRIEHLKKLHEIQPTQKEINGVSVEVDPEENRVKLFFPAIPNQDIRKKLKQNGFRWAPSVGAWQRQISTWAIHLAEEIAKEVC